ncbi:MAG: S41 family peptidase [Symbiobacteriaceae bacterium]|nr:S41 family peptidase [Symbiobacteriaceae bacterium]
METIRKYSPRRMFMVALILMLLLGVCFLSGALSRETEAPPLSLFWGEAQLLITWVEETHPAFLALEHLAAYPGEGYYLAKAEFLRQVAAMGDPYCPGSISVGDIFPFYLLCCEYLASLSDIHTTMHLPEGEYAYLPLAILWQAEGMFLEPTAQYPLGGEIVQIGGVAPEFLGKTVDRHTAAETTSGHYKNRQQFALFAHFFQLAGVVVEDNHEVELWLQVDGEMYSIRQAFAYYHHQEVPSSDFDSSASWSSDEEATTGAVTVTLLADNDILLVTAKNCTYDASFVAAMQSLEKALGDGISTIIFDVRDNPGGVSTFWQHFFSYLQLDPGLYGKIERYSQLNTRNPNIMGASLQEPQVAPLQDNPWEIVVLTNENSYSGAVWLATMLHDGGLGTVIGREPGSSPTMFGNPVEFILPHTALRGVISSSFFIRPNPLYDLTGDQLVAKTIPYGEDILEAALAYLLSLP